MKRRFLSILLVLAMVLCLMPGMSLTASAETYTPNYLTFTAKEDNSSIRFSWLYGSDVQISRDGGINWENYGKDTTISLNTGDTVSFKGKNIGTTYDYRFHMTGKISASGSVTSLTDENGGNPDVKLEKACYGSMFRECAALVTAPELPATKLSQSCYTCMFDGCKNLTAAPELPALEAAELCYSYMFASCSSLTEAPALPATVLGSQCYLSMFSHCTKLTKAPALPAETLKDYCYGYMFESCANLTTAPALPATTMMKGSYKRMFAGCTSLTAAPDLPATTLAEECYDQMFSSCSSLIIGTDRTDTSWKIHAQSVPDNAAKWDNNMFVSCKNVDFGDNSKTPALNTKYYTGNTRQALTPVTYIYYTADGNTAVRCDDGRCTEYETVAEDVPVFRNGKWYVVTDDVTIDNRITVKGTANLILCEGATLNALGGIDVSGENALNIFAQSENENTMGKLTAAGGKDATVGRSEIIHAGIGSGDNDPCGTVTIHGGRVTAYGGKDSAGIGGGWRGAGGTVTVYGGQISVFGDYGSGGIGAGRDGAGGTVTIYGGTVNAHGGAAGAGIGGSTSHYGGNITINGGTVNADGGYGGTGIGSGSYGMGGSVTINGGTVTAIGSDFEGVGIGGGKDSQNCTVTINGGRVTATGGDAGIGNCTLTLGEGLVFGAGESAENINRWGSNANTTEAVGRKYFVTPFDVFPYTYYTTEGATAIKHDDGCCLAYEIVTDSTAEFAKNKWYVVSENVTVNSRITVSDTANLILCDDATLNASNGIEVSEGSTLNVYGQSGGTGTLIANTVKDGSDAAIGSSYAEKGGSINIHGGIITATGSNNGAGIGGSNSNGCTVNIFDGTVNATGGKNSAGIGSGNQGADGTVTIYGGEVTATGGENSAAIGGGWNSEGGTITINGGTVNATGGENAAGIGSGYYGDGDTITINGGEVNATGGSGASAIGGKNAAVIINDGTITANGSDNGGYALGGLDGSITIHGGTVTAIGSESWIITFFDEPRCQLTLGEGVTFGAGESADNITVTSETNSVSDALGQKYFKTSYEPHTHSWSVDWTHDDVAHWHACTADGCTITNYSTCGENGAAYATHTWNNGVVTKSATHMEQGEKTYTCAECGATKTEAIDKLTTHTFDKEVADETKYLASAATCTEAAVYYKSCECNVASTTETFTSGSAKGHNYGTPTYTWDSSQCTAEMVCSVCAETVEGHTVTEAVTGSYVKDTAATCTQAETGHYEAEFTNEAFTAQQTAKDSVTNGKEPGHAFPETWEKHDADQHKHTCIRCKTETQYEKHTLTDATCTTPPYCLVCHEYVGDPLGHLLTAPDCTVAKFCLRCYETISPALGHDWGAYRDNGDGTHSRKCTRCSEYGETESHIYENYVCICGAEDLAGAKSDASDEIIKARTGASYARAEKALTDIEKANTVAEVIAIKKQALADMAKEDADADYAGKLSRAKDEALEEVDAAKDAARSDAAKGVSIWDIFNAATLEAVEEARIEAMNAIAAAEKELADAKAAAEEAILDEQGNDTSENVAKAAEDAISAIEAATNIDDVNAAKENGIKAIRDAKNANKHPTPIPDPYYTLNFHTNGGSAIGSVSGTYGKVIDLDKYVPAKDGFDFGGWYADKAMTSPVHEIKLTGSKTVYAKWIEKSPVARVLPFTDVKKTDWSYDDIAYVYEKGLMNGTSATTFSPKTDTSRAMIVTILWRLEGEPVANYAMSFEDVAPDQWYTEAIRWAQATGIVNGYSAEKFGINDPITREQMAAILYRYCKYKEYDVSIDENTNFLSYTDFQNTSEYAMQAMMWAIDNNILQGSNYVLSPQGNATREQVAAILHRFCENFVK